MKALQLKELLTTRKLGNSRSSNDLAYSSDNSKGDSLSYKELLQEYKQQRNMNMKQQQNKTLMNQQSSSAPQKSAVDMLNALSVSSGATANKVNASVNQGTPFITTESSFMTQFRTSSGRANTLKGDVNGDGVIDQEDKNLMIKYVAGKLVGKELIKKEDMNFSAGDFDDNGDITVSDLADFDITLARVNKPKPTGIAGDINNDGKVDSSDSEMLKKYIVGIVDEDEIYNADVNKDGKIGVADLDAINNIQEFGKVQKPTGVTGDINNDGKVNSTDIAMLKQHLVGLIGEDEIYNADVNNDGKIDDEDLKGVTNIRMLGKIQQPNGITGDINNDGEVDILDVTKLNSYLKGKIDATQIYNEDVDGNGVVDENDVKSVSNLILYGKVQKPNGITGDINNDGEVDILDATKLSGYLNGKGDVTRIYNEDVDGNGVVDENDVKSIANIIEYGKVQKPNGIIGDINNDGEVDIYDITKLKGYLSGKEDATRIFNEDVDGNGVVDENDVNAISSLIEYGKLQKPNGITGDINNDGKVDESDLTKLEKYLSGKEDVTRVYNEDVDGNGVVDENDVQAIRNIMQYGSIHEPEPISAPYQPWEARIIKEYLAYQDPGLTNHKEPEKVFVGDYVTVLDETENAYLVRYGVGKYPNYTDWKERWVSKKAILGENQPNPTPNVDGDYYARMQEFINNPRYQDGATWNDEKRFNFYDSNGTCLGKQCNAYAREFVKYVFGIEDMKGQGESFYDAGSIRAGDVVGVKGKEHWIVVLDRDGEDLTTIEGNWNGKVNYSTTAYKIINGELYRLQNGKMQPFRTFNVGYHFQSTPIESTPASVTYQQWESTAISDSPAYRNANLTNQGGTVWRGDDVTVVDETENAYKVTYGVGKKGNYTGYKTLWVPKNAIASSVQSKSSTERIVPDSNWIPDNPLITTINPHIGTTTTTHLVDRVTSSARIFQLTPGYRNSGYNANGGGLFIYNMNINENSNAISFDLYNTENASGYIEFYDKNGKFITAKRVEPNSHVITGISKWFSETGKLTESILRYGLESPVTDAYNSTKTPITAPEGTHTIVVTNNPNASLYAQVSTIIDQIFDTVDVSSKISNLIKDYHGLKNATATINQILVVPAKEKAVKEIMGEAVKEATKSGLNTIAQGLNREILKSIIEGIDLGKIVSRTFEENGGKIIKGATDAFLKSMVSEALKTNPAMFGFSMINNVGGLLDTLDRNLTSQKLKNVKPMVFQL